MTWKIRTTNAAAMGVSCVAGGLTCTLAIWQQMPFAVVVAATGVMAVVIYTCCRILFNRFVLFRIKPIYQILLAKNIHSSDILTVTQGADPVDNIRDELSRWADRQQVEISRLKENEQYRKEFLGNVSHEIKTPIFAIQGYILTLLDGGIEDPNINQKYLERAERNIDRLIDIVQDLEEITKLESGELILERERFDVVALARDIAEEVEMDALKRNIRIQIGKGSMQQPVYVNADRKRIAQVLNNLVVNSLKYGKNGGDRPGETHIDFVDGFDKVMVEVSDNGIGIAAEHLPRLFERFYRVDKSRSREQGGTGLGLAIAKHILEAHHENIAARSQPNEGTTFSFTLSKT